MGTGVRTEVGTECAGRGASEWAARAGGSARTPERTDARPLVRGPRPGPTRSIPEGGCHPPRSLTETRRSGDGESCKKAGRVGGGWKRESPRSGSGGRARVAVREGIARASWLARLGWPAPRPRSPMRRGLDAPAGWRGADGVARGRPPDPRPTTRPPLPPSSPADPPVSQPAHPPAPPTRACPRTPQDALSRGRARG